MIVELLLKHSNDDKNLAIIGICNLINNIIAYDQSTTERLIESDNILLVMLQIAENCCHDRKKFDVLRHILQCLASISVHSSDGRVLLSNFDNLKLLTEILEVSTDSVTVKCCLQILDGFLIDLDLNDLDQTSRISLNKAIKKARRRFIFDQEVLTVAGIALEGFNPVYVGRPNSFSVGSLFSPSNSFTSSRSRIDGETSFTSLQLDMVSSRTDDHKSPAVHEKQFSEEVNLIEMTNLTVCHQAEIAEKDQKITSLKEELHQTTLQLATMADKNSEIEKLSDKLEAEQKELQAQRVQAAENIEKVKKQLYDTRAEVDRLKAKVEDSELKYDVLKIEKDDQVLQLTEQFEQKEKRMRAELEQLNARLLSACEKVDILKDTIKDLEKRNLSAQDTLKALENRNETAEYTIKDLEKRHLTIQESLDKVISEKNIFKTRAMVLKSDLERLNAELQKQKAVNTHVQVWETEKQKLIEKYERTLVEEKTKLEAVIQDLQSSLRSKDSEIVDESGIGPEDVAIVMEQARCSKARAIAALQNNNNDLVEAIMELT